jgi:hypothetical protein
LAGRQTVEIHRLHLDWLASWWNAERGSSMRAAHDESCSDLITFAIISSNVH